MVTSNLPPAIAIVAQVIAADAGHARADTLLAIQGADPDHVRKHLAAIDTDLGTASPGLAALTALVDQAEDVVATSSPTVARQHVISQVVQRRFVETVPGHGRLLARYTLASGKVDLVGTNGAGYVSNFVPVDSKATEDLWQQVERLLRQATDAALNRTALGNLTHLSTLKAAVALHFVRNPQTLTVHNKSFLDAVDNYVDQVAKSLSGNSGGM